jgi:hypothetical protein
MLPNVPVLGFHPKLRSLGEPARNTMRYLDRMTIAWASAALLACSSRDAPSSSGADPSAADSGDGAVAAPADAGAPVLYATLNGGAAPSAFLGPTATSFRTGFTVIQGQAVLPAAAGDPLPTLADLTLRFATARRTLACDVATNPPDVAVQVVFHDDSSSALSRTATSTSDCAVAVSSYGDVGGRIVGTFSARLNDGTKMTEGVFDVPRGADQ